MKAGDRVVYIPNHAQGPEDYEYGTISSLNRHGEPWVKFDKQVAKLGWDGTTSQVCYLHNIKVIS